jgi:AraC family transcriptional regulator
METPVAVTSRDENTDPNWIGKVFLWQEQALFVGRASDTSLHASPAIKICVAIDGEIKLRTSENESWENFQAAIIAPGQVHAIDCRHSAIAMLVLVPEAEMAQPLAPVYTQKGVSAIRPSIVRGLLPLFEEFAQLDGFNVETEKLCRLLVDRIQADNQIRCHKQETSPLDPRVVSSIEHLRSENKNSASVKEIAANVALSESRFSHLFSEQLGVPVRRYLLWLRLREAMHLLAAGASLTKTAHEAGFADSAHLTRTFRGMLGIAPSSLLRHSSLIPAKE